MKEISSICSGNQRNTHVWRMYRIQERLSWEDARLKSIDRSLNLLTNYQQFKRLQKKEKNGRLKTSMIDED